MSARIPEFYRPGPGGAGPLRWQDDESGQLPAAVKAFVHYSAKQSDTPPTEDQLLHVREYFEYYVNAPCWEQGDTGKLDELRTSVKTLKTTQDLNDFIWACMEIGLDPL